MHGVWSGEAVGGANDAYGGGYVETDPSGRFGRFREILGKGATKTVYKAYDEMLGLEVAWNQVKLKAVFKSPVELQRLYSEVHLLQSLRHDSIIRFFTTWVDADHRTFNFITEMFTSGTLREYRQRYRRVNIGVVKGWARQILRGLAYLHSHDPPVIHRDLKCDNIFVNGHLGQVKIGDLGLAAILRGSQNAHSVIGTPEFMAPEVYEEEYNELVDIYSFGMCILEMLTSEYPYSECTNPAQIYKKVTSGKLPNAFYKIQDAEANKFVGKCLVSASQRPTAKELLMDPFLALDDDGQNLPIPHKTVPPALKPDSSDRTTVDHRMMPQPRSPPTFPSRCTAMTITGTMNPSESDEIFLKVQISNSANGQARNIYFPFDAMNDTAISVAVEMVNELEIKDWEPSEIAVMIEEEISSLLPSWNHGYEDSFSYEGEEYNGCHVGTHHPTLCHSYPYSPFSSQASLPASRTSIIRPANIDASCSQDWFQDTLFANDDVSSPDSSCSHKYSNFNYSSVNQYESDDFEWDADFDSSPSPSLSRVDPHFTTKSHNKSTRFCPAESPSTDNCNQQRGGCGGSHNQQLKLSRIRSLLDVRTQLLHRSLVEEIHKRRMFKTVGAVENIGFQEAKEEFPAGGSHVRRSTRSRKGGPGI